MVIQRALLKECKPVLLQTRRISVTKVDHPNQSFVEKEELIVERVAASHWIRKIEASGLQVHVLLSFPISHTSFELSPFCLLESQVLLKGVFA